jgi:hypothetical protein
MLLQCAIPVFEGLLPEPHNKDITCLLFILAHWHGLAKLWLHHDLTVKLLETVTTSLGSKLREFEAKTCKTFTTHELAREASAWMRRNMKANRIDARHTASCIANPHSSTQQLVNVNSESPTPIATSGNSVNLASHPSLVMRSQPGSENERQHIRSHTRRLKDFNLQTYKIHSLGDYASTI